ncbi:PAS domain of [Proteiniborus ethanoligenes]|uniref:histidine kinase n=1 Tax=Proteiniborus ethanoligenes TaxID=415015 RepID=A0A1H3S935_9FIRM|nr:ATP-binding protein [Proteiniborus ethanoligenes]SDZ34613.1 PAS domain of [Proteiniborus ethanoligenes]
MLLVVISLIIINTFISRIILNIYIEERKSNILIRANILSNDIKSFTIHNQIVEHTAYMESIILNHSKKINARIIVVDKKGLVIGDSNKEYLNKTFKHVEIQNALEGITSSNVYNFEDYGHVLYISVPLILQNNIVGATLISISINDIYSTVGNINKSLILISTACILIIAIISFVFLDFVFKPLERFTKAIIGMSKGDLKQKIEINTNDEFKKMADAFNAIIMKLDQVDRQREEFVANVSHELRTPISSMKLLSESLLHQDEEDIEVYKEFMSDISSESDRLNNIIVELLSLVDLDKEKLHLSYKITYINFLLEKIVNRMQPLSEQKNIQLILNLKEKIQIKVDAEKIQQAIINIIDNAIKYTQEYGEVIVSLYSKGRWAVIEVQDNGIGIPEESIGYIFDRFYRVDKARTRKTGGTGLGLSIAHQIITLHQGVIDIQSKVGEGSIFYIKIPQDIEL